MWFQVVLVLALIGIGGYLLRVNPSARHLAIRRIVMVMALVAGVIVIIWPGVLTALAQTVGVGRGVDFLFYVTLVAALLYVVNEYKRSILMARANSQLARELVLTEARLTDRITELEKRLAERDA